jgi:hypothetical protein
MKDKIEKNFQVGQRVWREIGGRTIETKEDLSNIVDEIFKANEESKPGTDVSASFLVLDHFIGDGVSEAFTKLRGKKVDSPEAVADVAEVLIEAFRKMPMNREDGPAGKKEGYSFHDLLADSRSGRIAKDTAQMREFATAVAKLSAESKIDIETVKKLLDIGLKVATIVSILL